MKQQPPPAMPAVRPLADVLAEIAQNVAAQQQAFNDARPDLIVKLQQRQSALFTEKRYAEWQAQGMVPRLLPSGD